MQAARYKVPPTLDARPVAGRLDLPLPAFVAEGYFGGVGPGGRWTIPPVPYS